MWLAATHFNQPVGELWEWQPDDGWTEVPGSEWNGPNGLVSSPDGRWFYIGGWGTNSLVRHMVARDDLDPESAHPAAQLREHLVAGIGLDPIQATAVYGDDRALDLDEVVLRHECSVWGADHPATELIRLVAAD